MILIDEAKLKALVEAGDALCAILDKEDGLPNSLYFTTMEQAEQARDAWRIASRTQTWQSEPKRGEVPTLPDDDSDDMGKLTGDPYLDGGW